MKPEVWAVFWEWLAGLLVGFGPLIGHLLVHATADATIGWQDVWPADIAVICITNSGQSLLTTFARLSLGNLRMHAVGILFVVTTILLLLSSATLYGLIASGHAHTATIWLPTAFVIGSIVTSLYFAMATMAYKS